MQATPLQLLSSNSLPKTLEIFARSLQMKDKSRPPPAAVYVPPHQRLRSVITAASPSPNLSPVTNVDSNSSTIKKSSDPYPYLFDLHELQEKEKKQKQEEINSLFDSRNVELPTQSGAYTSDNIDAWKWKLMTLIRDNDKQELVSREKKDRRDFEQIAALASRMGLHSCLYAKVLVVSKTPLPNYRFDLDDKRPQREVMLPPGLERRVDVHLKEYLSLKTRSAKGFRHVFSRSNSDGSISSDEGVFEQPEPLLSSKAAMEKIMWRRSMQLYTEQKAWQCGDWRWQDLLSHQEREEEGIFIGRMEL